MPGEKYQAWMVTTNDPEWKLELNDKVKFYVWQPEQPEGIGWHRQCYVELDKQYAGQGVSEALGHPVLQKGQKSQYFYKNEPRFGNQEQAITYCSSQMYCRECHKGDHVGYTQEREWSFEFDVEEHEQCVMSKDIKFKEWDEEEKKLVYRIAHAKGSKALSDKGKCGDTICAGIPLKGRGQHKKTNGQGDQQALIIEDIKAGKGRKYIFETYAGYAQRYHAWMDKALTLHAPVRQWMPACYYLYGTAGKRKSELARAVAPAVHVYEKPDSEKWFYGYDCHDIVIFNDLRKGDYKYSRLLKMFDRGPFEVENKGGSVQMLAKLMIVTAPMDLDTMWEELGGNINDNIDQMRRRFNYGAVPVEGEKPCNVYCLDDMDDDDMECLLYKMRCDLVRLRDPANWDKQRFSTWDGEGDIPEPPKKKLKTHDEASSSSTFKIVPRHKDRVLYPQPKQLAPPAYPLGAPKSVPLENPISRGTVNFKTWNLSPNFQF